MYTKILELIQKNHLILKKENSNNTIRISFNFNKNVFIFFVRRILKNNSMEILYKKEKNNNYVILTKDDLEHLHTELVEFYNER